MRDLEITVYSTACGKVAFGSTTPEGVAFLEATFPSGSWQDDEGGRPLYVVPSLRDGGSIVLDNPEELEPDYCAECGTPYNDGGSDEDFCKKHRKGSEGAPPYDAATATGMYDPEGA